MDVNAEESFCKNSKKKYFFLGGWGSGQGEGLGGQGGWERRSEACVKIKKIYIWGGWGRVGGGGVRVDVNGEVKLL